jgi:hypothetical protein
MASAQALEIATAILGSDTTSGDKLSTLAATLYGLPDGVTLKSLYTELFAEGFDRTFSPDEISELCTLVKTPAGQKTLLLSMCGQPDDAAFAESTLGKRVYGKYPDLLKNLQDSEFLQNLSRTWLAADPMLVDSDGNTVPLSDVIYEAKAVASAHVDAGKPITVTFKEFKRHFAGVCVGMSTYDVPAGLEAALAAVFAKAKPWFHTGDKFAQVHGVRQAERKELREQIESWVHGTPEVVAWNERRNGNQAEFAFSSRADIGHERDPDDDFVDLDALARNVTHGIVYDADEAERQHTEFDAYWAVMQPGDGYYLQKKQGDVPCTPETPTIDLDQIVDIVRNDEGCSFATIFVRLGSPSRKALKHALLHADPTRLDVRYESGKGDESDGISSQVLIRNVELARFYLGEAELDMAYAELLPWVQQSVRDNPGISRDELWESVKDCCAFSLFRDVLESDECDLLWIHYRDAICYYAQESAEAYKAARAMEASTHYFRPKNPDGGWYYHGGTKGTGNGKIISLDVSGDAVVEWASHYVGVNRVDEPYRETLKIWALIPRDRPKPPKFRFHTTGQSQHEEVAS